jgi:hypothetical protein
MNCWVPTLLYGTLLALSRCDYGWNSWNRIMVALNLNRAIRTHVPVAFAATPELDILVDCLFANVAATILK